MSCIGNKTLTKLGSIVALLALIFLLGCSGGGGSGGGDGDGFDPIAQDQDTIISLDDGGSIFILQDALPAGTQIEIVKSFGKPTLPEGLEAVGTAHLIFSDSELSLPATISLPIPEGENADDLAIVRIENSGKITILQTSVEGDLIEAYSPGFSSITAARLSSILKNINPKIHGPDVVSGDEGLKAQYFEEQFKYEGGLNRVWYNNEYGQVKEKTQLVQSGDPLQDNFVTLHFKETLPDDVQMVLQVQLMDPESGFDFYAYKHIKVGTLDEDDAPLDIRIVSPLVVTTQDFFDVKVSIPNLGDDSVTSWEWNIKERGSCETECTDSLSFEEINFDIPGSYALTVSATAGERSGDASFSVKVTDDLKIVEIRPDTTEVIFNPNLPVASASITGKITPTLPPYTYEWSLEPSDQWSSETYQSAETEHTVEPYFYQPGNYRITLRANDDEGGFDLKDHWFDIGECPDIEIMVDALPAEVQTDTEISVDLGVKGGCLILLGNRLNYAIIIDWGNNSPPEIKRLTASTPFNGVTTTFSHSYPVVGEYEIRIGAITEIPGLIAFPENAEQLDSDILDRVEKVSIHMPAKVGVKTIPIKIVENTSSAIEISISADIQSATVNEQVNFTSTVSGGQAPYTYKWDFDNNGTIDSNNSNPGHTFTAAGTYTVTLTVTDAADNEDTATLQIIVTEAIAHQLQWERVSMVVNPHEVLPSYDGPVTGTKITTQISQSSLSYTYEKYNYLDELMVSSTFTCNFPQPPAVIPYVGPAHLDWFTVGSIDCTLTCEMHGVGCSARINVRQEHYLESEGPAWVKLLPNHSQDGGFFSDSDEGTYSETRIITTTHYTTEPQPEEDDPYYKLICIHDGYPHFTEEEGTQNALAVCWHYRPALLPVE